MGRWAGPLLGSAREGTGVGVGGQMGGGPCPALSLRAALPRSEKARLGPGLLVAAVPSQLNGFLLQETSP